MVRFIPLISGEASRASISSSEVEPVRQVEQTVNLQLLELRI